MKKLAFLLFVFLCSTWNLSGQTQTRSYDYPSGESKGKLYVISEGQMSRYVVAYRLPESEYDFEAAVNVLFENVTFDKEEQYFDYYLLMKASSKKCSGSGYAKAFECLVSRTNIFLIEQEYETTKNLRANKQ
jgi:hypothetical protein